MERARDTSGATLWWREIEREAGPGGAQEGDGRAAGRGWFVASWALVPSAAPDRFRFVLRFSFTRAEFGEAEKPSDGTGMGEGDTQGAKDVSDELHDQDQLLTNDQPQDQNDEDVGQDAENKSQGAYGNPAPSTASRRIHRNRKRHESTARD